LIKAPHPRRGTAHRRQFKLPDLLGRRAPVEEQRRLYGAAVRQVTAHDDGRGDDDAAGYPPDRGSSSQRLAG